MGTASLRRVIRVLYGHALALMVLALAWQVWLLGVLIAILVICRPA